jgi:hypothetical protein
MSTSPLWTAVSIAGLAFGFILAGLIFGDERLIGYGSLGVGVLLAFLDIFNRSRRRPRVSSAPAHLELGPLGKEQHNG